MTIEEIRSYAEEMGLPPKRIDKLIAELHPDENGKLSPEEYFSATAAIAYINDTRENVRHVLESTKANRNQRGNTESEKKTSDAQRRAVQKYKKEKAKRFAIDFSQADAELWEHIQNQPNKQGYIKSLIRADMERGGEK